MNTTKMLIICLSFLCWDSSHLEAKEKIRNKKFAPTTKENTIRIINQTQKTEEIINRSFKVIVWNIFKGVKAQLFKDFKQLTKDYDFLILQEAYSTTEMMKMFEESPHHFTMASAFIYLPDNLYSGIITGSKFKHQRYEYVRGKYNEPLIDAPKLSLMNY